MGYKILLVSDHYPPFIGGAHRQTQLLAKELSQRGHEVSVATVWHGGFPELEEEGGVKVYRLKQLRTWPFRIPADRKQRHQPPFPDPVTVAGLRTLVKRFKPDLIHSYGWISYSCAAALTGKNLPLLISARDYTYSCATQTMVYRGQAICSGPRLRKCLSCASTRYGLLKGWVTTLGVSLSQGMLRRKMSGLHSISTYVQQITRRDFLGERNGRQGADKKVTEAIIPSFQEDAEPQPHGREFQIQPYLEQLPAEPYILFVGALRRVKGIYQLLEAYQQLQNPPPLVLIGTVEFDTPPQFPPGVTVLQDFPHPAIMAAWERSLFGVIPSLWPEPLGSVIYEGMSKGKAMIGTTPGGHTDMIAPGETGFLVPAGDVVQLTAAMQRLIDDPLLRDRMGLLGCERARAYTASVAVPKFEELYTRLIEGRHA